MRSWLARHLSYANVMATLAVFIALATGGAYAANTIGSDDIIDGQVMRQDLANGSVQNAKLADNGVTTAKIRDLAVTNIKIAPGAVTYGRLGPSAVTTDKVMDNSLTGADIDESTLTGVKDGCHAGATLFGRLCAVSDNTSRALDTAFTYCASIGLRLPTWSEAVTLAKQYDVPGVAINGFFWTAEVVTVGTNGFWDVVVVFEDGSYASLNTQGATVPTVCVETPTDVS
jgi:hypothetical protein